ncbi:hypothetical protein BDV39DRAFT_181929 [Aspergillus sergii]|uniref:Uncharacterized protein n=1 Tax=Aspergillus sergii TaxID=1034303 RepID=A0A5N6WRW3_9EURO|nr:hypothetical protein BDV39DRAFT_181929 [Aspergillus sergii]
MMKHNLFIFSGTSYFRAGSRNLLNEWNGLLKKLLLLYVLISGLFKQLLTRGCLELFNFGSHWGDVVIRSKRIQ